MSRSIAVILAAGKGTRMKSDLPKVLVAACGRPLVDYVLDAVTAAGIEKSIVVVGYRSDDVRQTLKNRSGVEFAEQTEQLGTGHAVQMAAPALEGFDGPVLVVTGDSPMAQVSSFQALLDLYHREHPACVMGTLLKDDPTGLGRIVRDENGDFLAIVEEKDATPEQRSIREVNMSTYVFDCQALLRSLGKLRNDNRQAEYYITDVPGILREEGADVRALAVLQPCEALSVNTVDDLAIVEAELRRQGK
ncbi:MAG: NTP transferase domain-containing protein [Planctomycetales bacterium]|nr:NTP transferase domain-containing protein [Planctomycetales bacterium]